MKSQNGKKRARIYDLNNQIRFVFVHTETHTHTGAYDDLQSKITTEFR